MEESKMNIALRNVARNLKYRALPQLVGIKITVTSVASAVYDVTVQMKDRLPAGSQFQGPEERYIEVVIAKYGILDLTFAAAEISWSSDDGAGIPLLEEFGFVVRESPTEEGPGLLDSDDPTCLAELQDDIKRQEAVIRLFLEERPKRNMKEFFSDSRKMESLSAGDMDPLLENYFPKTFEVVDACLTNAGFIWFHKHFYM
jgi:hypothetical protein